jgi:PAS domain S-box-containing protein
MAHREDDGPSANVTLAGLDRNAALAHFQALLKVAPIGLGLLDRDVRYVHVNATLAAINGQPAEAHLGRTMREVVPHIAVDLDAVVRRVLDTGEMAFNVEWSGEVPGRPGEHGDWLATYYPVGERDGRVLGVGIIVLEITAQKRAERALATSEKRYRAVVESQQDLVARTDPEGHLTFVNDSYCQSLGLSHEDAIGMDFKRLVHEDDLPRIREAFTQLEQPPHRGITNNRARTPSGWRWFEWESCAILADRSRMVEVQVVGRDITERLAAEQALRESLEKLRLLAQQQTAIREQECRRLGFDLHDDVCQGLVGIGILVESMRQRLGHLPAEIAADFGRVARHLGEMTERLRGLARELQPIVLRDLGLDGALRLLAKNMSSESVRVVMQLPTPAPRLPEEIELSVYRIVQEALSNALRHASPRSVVVMLRTVGGTLHVEVSDDGRGFDTVNRPGALGLLGMEERALAIGARFTLQSKPGKGTTVSLDCPLP